MIFNILAQLISRFWNDDEFLVLKQITADDLEANRAYEDFIEAAREAGYVLEIREENRNNPFSLSSGQLPYKEDPCRVAFKLTRAPS